MLAQALRGAGVMTAAQLRPQPAREHARRALWGKHETGMGRGELQPCAVLAAPKHAQARLQASRLAVNRQGRDQGISVPTGVGMPHRPQLRRREVPACQFERVGAGGADADVQRQPQAPTERALQRPAPVVQLLLL